MKTRISDLLSIEYPIIQGAMQYLARAELAAAVSNAGGLGIIPAMTFRTGDELRAEIQKVKSLTDKPFGVNISLVPDVVVPDLITEYLKIIIEEEVHAVETSGQKPTLFVKPLKEAGIKLIHKVATVHHAISAEKEGVDAVTVVAFEAGGHPGMEDVAGSVLFPKAVESLSIPVLGGGGIVDGKSMYAAMAYGLDGVVMGTRFLASKEIGAPDAFKEKIIQFQENQTVLTLRSLRNALRTASNPLSQKILEMESQGASLQELFPYISGIKTYEAIMKGDFDNAQMSMGQGIGRIEEVQSVQEIIANMVAEFKATHEKMSALV